MDFSPTVRQSFPRQQPSGPKIDTHGYPGVIMGGTTLDPKHNVGKRTPTECVDHGRFTGSRHRWSSEASSYEITLIGTLVSAVTHILTLGKKVI
ncbi:ras-like protein family member 11b [Plakobranchus ocellatus]|uniref:Ras-like protein family member 11b n=1 Tax=Plakobranchus ocellatus TaxID=259542 RepID=A0AAV4CN11_9GAST|nr:ras-like protein family member 11b [Plakobranchus ocellatus]